MMSFRSPIPAISISPAPEEEPVPEPYSPFAWLNVAPSDDENSFRPNLLTPPATFSSSPRSLSPLRGVERTARGGAGLERSRFEELLRKPRSPSGRLPAFLRTEPKQGAPVQKESGCETALDLSSGVGRLRIPVGENLRLASKKPEPIRILPPVSPRSPVMPDLEITTLVVPRSATKSPVELSEGNLLALDLRERRSQAMMSALKRRSVPSECAVSPPGLGDGPGRNRRWSSPAELSPRARDGFEHPVLALPGAF